MSEQILKNLIAELECALELDRGPATSFKEHVWRALTRAQKACLLKTHVAARDVKKFLA